jgi:hypothetical protein
VPGNLREPRRRPGLDRRCFRFLRHGDTSLLSSVPVPTCSPEALILLTTLSGGPSPDGVIFQESIGNGRVRVEQLPDQNMTLATSGPAKKNGWRELLRIRSQASRLQVLGHTHRKFHTDELDLGAKCFEVCIRRKGNPFEF